MNKRTLLVSLALAGSLVIAPALPAAAAPTTEVSQAVMTAKIKRFANCTAMHKVYKGGVAKAGVKYNKVSGKNRAFGVRPKASTALYLANKRLDRDGDGIACER